MTLFATSWSVKPPLRSAAWAALRALRMRFWVAPESNATQFAVADAAKLPIGEGWLRLARSKSEERNRACRSFVPKAKTGSSERVTSWEAEMEGSAPAFASATDALARRASAWAP